MSMHNSVEKQFKNKITVNFKSYKMEQLVSTDVNYTSFNKLLSIKNVDTTYEKSILNQAFPRC